MCLLMPIDMFFDKMGERKIMQHFKGLSSIVVGIEDILCLSLVFCNSVSLN